MQAILDWVGRRFRQGTLEFRNPDGRTWTLGLSAPRAVIELRDASTLWKILRNPELNFCETYMNGGWLPADGDLMRALEVGIRMTNSAPPPNKWQAMRLWLTRLHEANSPLKSRKNVHHHYDLDHALYSAFLDRDLHYSCAYFKEPDMSLEAAQQAKCAHIAAKLDLRPGARVLDIGCGWGSLAIYLAEHFGVHVTGITLSEEQLKVAHRRAQERGLSKQIEFRLEDYRQTAGEFDAVVSVGMFEHVGRPQYSTFFRRVRELLKPNGSSLLHFIGRTTPPGRMSPWIDKYIFPGGYIPAASETLAAAEPNGLILSDFEVWRLHYAMTLAEWRRRFHARRGEFEERFGERFCRMWEFYLASSEASFRWGDLVVFQLQLTRDIERMPLSRDYLYRSDETALTARQQWGPRERARIWPARG